MREHKIGGIPVTDNAGKLVGIVTNRDLRFEKQAARPIAAHDQRNLIVTEDEATFQAEQILREHRIEKLPVVDGEGKLVNSSPTATSSSSASSPTRARTNTPLRGRGRGRTDTHERVSALVDAGVDAVIVATAHGHNRGVIDTVRDVKKSFDGIDIVAGNVATAEAATRPGRRGRRESRHRPRFDCTIVIAEPGVPQLRAVMEVSQALEGTGVPVIADGGIRYTGDIVKALAGGGHTVMIGSPPPRREPGETIIYEGRRFKAYRGMGSGGHAKGSETATGMPRTT